MEKVILVNQFDEVLGEMEKMEAHKKGILHRAFSIFIFNSKGQLMIQKRAATKYHSAGLWTNTCCSHPRKGESLVEASIRRLKEEMGFSCPIRSAFSFIYKAELGKGLIEHELDHVLIGFYNGLPQINPLEVEDWKYVELSEIELDILKHPENYTSWFKICFKQLHDYYLNNVA